MIGDFQRQALRRKFVYIGLIITLFFVALIFRTQFIEKKAEALELREKDVGEVELTDKALRLTLTGSRGLAVCALWYAATEKQKRHEWNELELLIRSLIKLQPHFQTPWLFQSWNLSYNVSAECDRINDKYFHIAQGVQLLSDGSRQNKDSANMRYFVGFYLQDKIGLADQKNALRSLFQLSCIDPADRDPARLRRTEQGKSLVDIEQFEKFAVQHPFLVRRLRDRLRCNRPEDVVRFLEENQKIPCRFEDQPEGSDTERAARLRPIAERFPPLPGPQKFNPNEVNADSDLADDFDNYHAARAWYGFAQDPVRAGKKRTTGMLQVLFEGYPARAQAYIGEYLENEGWFDETGWTISDWFPRDRSHPRGAMRSVTLGKDRSWAMDVWGRAYQMYLDYGEFSKLNVKPEEMDKLSDAEKKNYEQDRSITNIAHHIARAEVEKERKTVTARRCFYEADELRKHGDRDQALKAYERPEAFPAWKDILVHHPVYGEDADVQEETFIMQRKYLALVLEKRVPLYRQMMVWQGYLAMGSAPWPATPLYVPARALMPTMRVAIFAPFDGVNEKQVPLISAQNRMAVINRLNLAPEYDLPRPIMLDTSMGQHVPKRMPLITPESEQK